MRRLGRFFILAAIGFVLGGALAYFQGLQAAKNTAPQQVETASGIAAEEGPIKVPENLAEIINQTAPADAVPVPAESVIAQAPPVAASENAVSEAAMDPGTGTGAHTNHAGAEAMPAPQPLPGDQATAGSSVGGAFTLTDHNGQTITEKSWPGKHKLVFFGFTHCPDICPATLDKLTTALGTLGAEGEKIQPLFITTDAGRDTPEVMKAYISGYHPSIVGLTGTEEQLKAAQETYKVYAAKVPGADAGAYTMDHSAFVFLMSPDDRLLDIFKKDDTAEDISAKIKMRVTQASPALSPAP